MQIQRLLYKTVDNARQQTSVINCTRHKNVKNFENTALLSVSAKIISILDNNKLLKIRVIERSTK